jgi:hypothetical protein
MDAGRLLKWIVIAALLFGVWKYVVPWVKNEAASEGAIPAAAVAGRTSCPSAADRASSAWGAGLGRFVNPPYDLDAWSSFKQDVESKITQAESECSCEAASCATVRDAMSDLRGLVTDFDGAIRTGNAPPEDAVMRQERIDDRITQAMAAGRGGQ